MHQKILHQNHTENYRSLLLKFQEWEDNQQNQQWLRHLMRGSQQKCLHASTFVETPSSNAAAIVDSAGYPPTLEILVGGYGNFQYDFGAGSFDAFNLVTLTPVPEPSSAALLGLGGLALLMRRRRESNLWLSI